MHLTARRSRDVTRRQPRFRQEHDSAFLYFHTVSYLGHLAK
jgi:hypothetical protein